MSGATQQQKRRFQPGEIVLSEAEGYYASFHPLWFDKIEPPSIRLSDTERTAKFATRMLPCLSEPNSLLIKATLSPSSPDYDPQHPDRVIGHSGWLLPARTSTSILSFWRREAAALLDWPQKMGWSAEYEESLWEGTDVEAYTKSIKRWDDVRETYVSGVGHWLLSPLWVVPEYQGRGVGGMLIEDGIRRNERAVSERGGEGADVMYLEFQSGAKGFYERYGWREVKEGKGVGWVMIRGQVEGVEVQSLDGDE